MASVSHIVTAVCTDMCCALLPSIVLLLQLLFCNGARMAGDCSRGWYLETAVDTLTGSSQQRAACVQGIATDKCLNMPSDRLKVNAGERAAAKPCSVCSAREPVRKQLLLRCSCAGSLHLLNSLHLLPAECCGTALQPHVHTVSHACCEWGYALWVNVLLFAAARDCQQRQSLRQRGFTDICYSRERAYCSALLFAVAHDCKERQQCNEKLPRGSFSYTDKAPLEDIWQVG